MGTERKAEEAAVMTTTVGFHDHIHQVGKRTERDPMSLPLLLLRLIRQTVSILPISHLYPRPLLLSLILPLSLRLRLRLLPWRSS